MSDDTKAAPSLADDFATVIPEHVDAHYHMMGMWVSRNRNEILTALRAVEDAEVLPDGSTPNTYEKPKDGWVCFHCGKRFTTYPSARNHFGYKPESIEELRAELASQKSAVEAVRAVCDSQAAPPGQHSQAGAERLIRDLVARFAEALAAKLIRSEEKYGWNSGWRETGWMDKCRADLRRHLEKGDPLDVAAYCAFLWHHAESTSDVSPGQRPQNGGE